MARPIDAYTLNNDLVSWYNDTEDEKEKSILRRVMQRVVQAPALTPQNGWVNRVLELDELYIRLQVVTGFTAEQLLEMFAAGYTLEKPDYSKSFEEMASLAETTPPNEPLPVLVLNEPDREYIDYICPKCKEIISQCRRGQHMSTVYQCKYHDRCGQRVDWANPEPYRRPPEGEANA